MQKTQKKLQWKLLFFLPDHNSILVSNRAEIPLFRILTIFKTEVWIVDYGTAIASFLQNFVDMLPYRYHSLVHAFAVDDPVRLCNR